MSNVECWQMNRAGLVNFWYYVDEIFHFADGKLLLRGSNGSGKSVTMQSFLPVLLDGKKTPDRLDPFGSRARKMEDYLLGEYEVTKRDERTGYLFLEYRKKNTDQYVTTGIGLKAKRHKSMDFWGFVIKDGRRIGKDLFLYNEEKSGGHVQKIPLAKKDLEQTIGDGGIVVDTQKEYMELVNKYIFGFETIEAFDDLIKLLIQLRSPKLSKDFRPTVIYGILEQSLPEISDDELRSLTDTIESMDQAKHQLEQLERDYESLAALNKHYEEYNQFVLVDQANELLQTEKIVKIYERELEHSQQQLTQLREQLYAKTEEEAQLKINEVVASDTKKQLETHEVFNAEQEKSNVMARYNALQAELADKQRALEQKEKKERELKQMISRYENIQYKLERQIEDKLHELEADAEQASFQGHAMNAKDFLRYEDVSFDFTLWKKEVDAYRQHLQQISKLWDEYERLKSRFDDADKQLAAAKKRLDSSRSDKEKWQTSLDEEKLKLVEAIWGWMVQYEVFQLDEETKQLTAQKVHDLLDIFSEQQLIEPFTAIYVQKQQAYLTEQAQLQNDQKQCEQQLAEAQQQLMHLQNMKEPELTLHPDTIAARKLLIANGVDFIPFYKAVEFRDEVTEQQRANIEAALAEAGMLDALIMDNMTDDFMLQHDKLLVANNRLLEEQQSLFRWLYVDLPEGATVPTERVKQVLQSIDIDMNDRHVTTVIQADGSYKIGAIHGHAPHNTKGAQYIGTQARERYRKKLITEIEQHIKSLQSDMSAYNDQLAQVKWMILHLEQGYQQFPAIAHVKTAYDELKLTNQQLVRDQQEVDEKNESMKRAYVAWEQVRLSLQEQTKAFPIEFAKEAYERAKTVMVHYGQELQELRLIFAEYKSNRQLLEASCLNLDGMLEDIDELKGEQTQLKDRCTIEQLKLEQLQKRLAELGAEEIRQQINDVLQQLAFISKRLPLLTKEIARLETDIEVLKKDITLKEQQLIAYKILYEDWLTVFREELQLQSNEIGKQALDPLQIAKMIYKEHSELLKKETRAAMSDKLNKIFYREQQVLVEYRLTQEVASRVFEHIPSKEHSEIHLKRVQLSEKAHRSIILLDYKGQRVTPAFVLKAIARDISLQKEVLNETDRELYEEIILNSVGRVIRAKIQRAERWVKAMNDLMEKRDTSSGLNFSLKWKPKTADAEAEMDTNDLVELLRSDPRLLKDNDMKRVTAHFRSKISRARELSTAEGYGTTLHQIMKEILDYRKWFSFTLFYKREGETKKELTNNVFFAFSGGEKAMAMYIPLFSAVYSRYQEAKKDAPRIISLDEAFAGVDENNIRDMFALVEELGFNYIMNSQAIYGDYDSVSSLSICELLRPKNAPYVTVIRYYWNGKVRTLVQDGIDR